jgi:hypothetical protein
MMRPAGATMDESCIPVRRQENDATVSEAEKLMASIPLRSQERSPGAMAQLSAPVMHPYEPGVERGGRAEGGSGGLAQTAISCPLPCGSVFERRASPRPCTVGDVAEAEPGQLAAAQGGAEAEQQHRPVARADRFFRRGPGGQHGSENLRQGRSGAVAGRVPCCG